MNRIKSRKMIVIALSLLMGVCILSFTSWGAPATYQRGITRPQPLAVVASATIAGNPATLTSGVVTTGTVTANAITCPASFTVNSLGDTANANPGNGACADASGNCTLRAAIQEANALLTCAPLTINFNVKGTINLAAAFPISLTRT